MLGEATAQAKVSVAPAPRGTGSLAQEKHGMAWGARKKCPDRWGWGQTSEAPESHAEASGLDDGHGGPGQCLGQAT